MLANLIENGQCTNQMDTSAAENALAALVRAGDQMDYGLQVEAGSPANGREWRAALSALASALGVTEEA